MEIEPSAIILRERTLSSKGEPSGWVVIVAGPDREREVLAVLTNEVGLEVARKFAQMLASKYRVIKREELFNTSINSLNQAIDSIHYSQS